LKIKRLLVTGSRDWNDEKRIEDILRSAPHDAVLVHGACPTGADAIADRIWSEWGRQVERHPADWKQYGKRAGFVRNAEMAESDSALCLAFIKGDSRGASMTAQLAEDKGVTTMRFSA